MNKIIDDDFLYQHIPNVEKLILERIPPESELSHQFSRHFKRKMKALLKYESRTPTMRLFIHRIRTAVAIFLIILSITFGTVMSVEAYRVRFFEFITQVWEELTSIVIHSDENANHDTITPIFPSYIPEGYIIVDQINDKYENTIIYINEGNLEIYYSQKMSTQSEFILDSEGAKIKKIMIESQEAYLIINKGTIQLYWYDSFNIFSLIGNLDETELIKMATSIIK